MGIEPVTLICGWLSAAVFRGTIGHVTPAGIGMHGCLFSIIAWQLTAVHNFDIPERMQQPSCTTRLHTAVFSQPTMATSKQQLFM